MSIKSKIKSKYMRFLISTRNLINQQLESEPLPVTDIELGSPIEISHHEITSTFKRRLVKSKIKELLQNVQSTYQFNNGRLNKEQILLLSMYKRELNSIK